jgi:hypothetical protein
MTVFGALLYFASRFTGPRKLGHPAILAHHENVWLLFDLVMLGVFGGFYIIPLYALYPDSSALGHRSRIIA